MPTSRTSAISSVDRRRSSADAEVGPVLATWRTEQRIPADDSSAATVVSRRVSRCAAQATAPRSDRRRGRIPRHVFVVRRASHPQPRRRARRGSGFRAPPDVFLVARRRLRHSPLPANVVIFAIVVADEIDYVAWGRFSSQGDSRGGARGDPRRFRGARLLGSHSALAFSSSSRRRFSSARRARIRPRGPPVSLAKIRARRRGQPRVVRAEASRDRRRASTDSPRGERRVA